MAGEADLGGARRRFKAYPAYRDSGVEWLEDLPAHWDVKPLKFHAPVRSDGLKPKPGEATYVALENIESWTGRISLENRPEDVESVVASFRAGDVLFDKPRPYLAKVARPDFDGALRAIAKSRYFEDNIEIGECAMEATRVTASQFQQAFGQLSDRARRQPVVITKHGRDSLVVIPVEEWERLKRRDRRVGLTSDLPAEWLDAVRVAEAPAEFAHLDADLE